MTCYHPLKGFQIGVTVAGRPDYKICSYDTDHVEYNGKCWSACLSPRHSIFSSRFVDEFIEIPCGHCIGCRLDYSRQWADRCMLEMQEHESSYFITLTYDDMHLPLTSWLDKETGECGTISTLIKRDFQLFMKRLRKSYKYDNKIRYFACGEYGSQSLRPHYHAIVFGLKLDDLVFYKQCNGFKYYNSEFVSKCWQNKGFVVVAPATWETCAYTARYVMKKQNGASASVYGYYNIESEFSLASRRPGIGRKYFDDHCDTIFDCDFISLSTPDGSKQIKPCRYFKKLLQQFDEDSFLDFKIRKEECIESIKDLKLSRTSNNYLDMLSTAESVKLASISALKRKEV